MDAPLNFCIILLLLASLELEMLNAQAPIGKAKAIKYFNDYGYLNGTYSPKPSEMYSGIVRFQYFSNLRISGKLDEDTLAMMDKERCGIKDPQINVPLGKLSNVPSTIKRELKAGVLRRIRRFNVQGSTWKKNVLTWKLLNLPRYSKITRTEIQRTIHQAASLWTRQTNMEFEEMPDNNSDTPDINVKFGTYQHGDPFPFDGPGGTLAHAFYPLTNKGFSGDMHFDDDENFSIKSQKGINLLWVATHELGHSLGLDHSPVPNAVMFPWYQKYKPGFDLQDDDILGIQSIYGKKDLLKTAPPKKKTTKLTTLKPTTIKLTTQKPITASTMAPKRTTKKLTTPDNDVFGGDFTTPATTLNTRRIATTRKHLPPITQRTTTTVYVPRRPCPTEAIDAIYDIPRINHRAFIAGGKYLYFMAKTGIKYGPLTMTNYYPRSIIPSIDAAFNMEFGNSKITVFFSSFNYYIFRLFTYQSGPHSIYSRGSSNPLNLNFPSWVRKIDGAMRWHRNDNVYIFASGFYWKYDDSNTIFSPGYPQQIKSGWKNVPEKIDTCFSSSAEKRTFFISGDQFYLFDDRTVAVANSFPKHFGDSWLNCGDSRRRQFIRPTLPPYSGPLANEP